MYGTVRFVLAKAAGKAFATGFLLLYGLQAVHAQSGRPDTRQMTCAQAQSLVKQRGRIVLSTGPVTYETFVSDARYCDRHAKMVRVKFAPTRDDPKCPVGNRCYQNRNNRD